MEPSTDEINEIAQLAKTFSTACKETVEEGKARTYKAPVVTTALVLLTAGAALESHWP